MTLRALALLIVIPALLPAGASAQARPRDFDAFWNEAKRDLAAVPMDAQVAPDAEHTDAHVACFKVRYASLNREIHARYCRPARDGKFPAVLINPWDSQGAIDAPTEWAKRGMAALWYQARGFEVDRSTYPLANSVYVLDGIDAPGSYVYREIAAHGLRGLDFLAARPEVDVKRLGVAGAGQGGGLSLLLAGLDPRISAVSADAPFLTDWPESLTAENPPYADVRKYLAEHKAKRAAAKRTLTYFDTLDVAGRLRGPVFVQAALKDRTCPPGGIEKLYRRIPSRRKLWKAYPDADHTDEGPARWKAAQDFLADALGAR
jgi:cephalosporin-C deacetylase